MTQHREGTLVHGQCITGHHERCPVTTTLSQTGIVKVCPCTCHDKK